MKKRAPIFLRPGEGREYPMGRIRALFKADGAEGAGRYSVSEWWLEPRTKGPGAHAHEEDDLFYVLEGTMSFRLGERWVDAPAGSFVLAPAGATHDFENRGRVRAGVLNFSCPGDFEASMPEIAAWFRDHPPAEPEAPAPAPATAPVTTWRAGRAAGRAAAGRGLPHEPGALRAGEVGAAARSPHPGSLHAAHRHLGSVLGAEGRAQPPPRALPTT